MPQVEFKAGDIMRKRNQQRKIKPYGIATPIIENDYITIQQLADQLECSTITLIRRIEKGDLPGYDIGDSGTGLKAWHRDTLKTFHAQKRQSRMSLNPINLKGR